MACEMERLIVAVLVAVTLTGVRDADAQQIYCQQLQTVMSNSMLQYRLMGLGLDQARNAILPQFRGTPAYPVFSAALEMAYSDPRAFGEAIKDGSLMNWCLQNLR
ncbi:MAG: hypothetical protein ACOYMG_03650 [Candidatus Methylumidiphilus sp.]